MLVWLCTRCIVAVLGLSPWCLTLLTIDTPFDMLRLESALWHIVHEGIKNFCKQARKDWKGSHVRRP